mmetsp:Transcript_15926/g.24795  ORF Transcript_15926/g.24795 Transcript_15926/m.24795 type:complete len:141 (-) Transcript_15926:1421-1843(-)
MTNSQASRKRNKHKKILSLSCPLLWNLSTNSDDPPNQRDAKISVAGSVSLKRCQEGTTFSDSVSAPGKSIITNTTVFALSGPPVVPHYQTLQCYPNSRDDVSTVMLNKIKVGMYSKGACFSRTAELQFSFSSMLQHKFTV